MAATPYSSVTPYATVDDLIARVDVRYVQQITSDDEDGNPTPLPSLYTNERVLAALADASGQIESECTVGQRYTPDDLRALVGNSRSLLTRITCQLAVGLLWEGRPSFGPKPEVYKDALATLEKIGSGKSVFGLTAQQLAGNMTETVETTQDVEARHGPVVEAVRFFSRRNDQGYSPPYG